MTTEQEMKIDMALRDLMDAAVTLSTFSSDLSATDMIDIDLVRNRLDQIVAKYHQSEAA